MKSYRPYISATVNSKGVLDIDTVKGCRIGLEKYPNGGCYGLCYAAKIAKFYKYDFSESVSRKISKETSQIPLFGGLFIGCNKQVYKATKEHKKDWFRIGTMGDPSHDWELTKDVCLWLGKLKTPVIVTKHWKEIPDSFLPKFRESVINTSISALDTGEEINQRIGQFKRIKSHGIKSTLRIVSCEFGQTEEGRRLSQIQSFLFSLGRFIDTPLRIPLTDKRVISGDILVDKIKCSNGSQWVSLMNKNTHLGACSVCPDRCGTAFN